MRAHFLGVRGSTPAPGEDFVRYGGYTSCVALAHDGDAAPTLLLDAGTGIRRVAARCALARPSPARFCSVISTGTTSTACRSSPPATARTRASPSSCPNNPTAPLRPTCSPGACRRRTSRSVPKACAASGASPTWRPGRWRSMASASRPWRSPTRAGVPTATASATASLCSPTCPITAPRVLGSGPDGWGEYHSQALELATSTDALVHDAQLMAEELEAADFFGHAAAEYAVELARCAGARRVVLFHHQPDRTDNALDELGKRFGKTSLRSSSRPSRWYSSCEDQPA